jgi:hypothetical protein
LVGVFRRTLGGRPKNKEFENPFQINPTPCKNNSKPTTNKWVTIQEWICAQNLSKTNEKNLKNLEKWVFGFLWGKLGDGGQWWPAVGDNGGERPVVVF